jgi:hypothetical protein
VISAVFKDTRTFNNNFLLQVTEYRKQATAVSTVATNPSKHPKFSSATGQMHAVQPIGISCVLPISSCNLQKQSKKAASRLYWQSNINLQLG